MALLSTLIAFLSHLAVLATQRVMNPRQNKERIKTSAAKNMNMRAVGVSYAKTLSTGFSLLISSKFSQHWASVAPRTRVPARASGGLPL